MSLYVLGWMAPCVPSVVIALMLRLRAEVRVSRVSFSQNRAGRLTFQGGNSSRLHGKLKLWLVLGRLIVGQKVLTLRLHLDEAEENETVSLGYELPNDVLRWA